MESGRNRVLVALGSLAAIALLLGAFVVVWLVPRGPEIGNANVSSSNSSSTTKPASGSASSQYAQTGAPSMAPISDQPHISVRGTGTISAKPDIVNLQIGVQIQKDSLDAAQAEAATKMDAAMNQLKAAGIDEKDISTAQFNVEPVMEYRDNQAPRVTGFRVTNILAVKVRDISKAGTLIDSLISSGANTVYGVSFGFSDPSALMKQAREQAMADAKSKAEQLATLGGVGLGTPILIDDGGANVPPPVVPYAGDASMERAAGAAPTPINPGQQEIRVDVTVLYGIK
jgi:uncharacterized protein